MTSSGLLFCSLCSKLHTVAVPCEVCFDVTYCSANCKKRDLARHASMCRLKDQADTVAFERVRVRVRVGVFRLHWQAATRTRTPCSRRALLMSASESEPASYSTAGVTTVPTAGSTLYYAS